MELKALLSQSVNGLTVSIHIDDLNVTNLSQLTERDIKESVRPLIESYYRIEQKCKDAENISRFLCYGTPIPQSVSQEHSECPEWSETEALERIRKRVHSRTHKAESSCQG